jgi:hypothetical protein
VIREQPQARIVRRPVVEITRIDRQNRDSLPRAIPRRSEITKIRKRRLKRAHPELAPTPMTTQLPKQNEIPKEYTDKCDP